MLMRRISCFGIVGQAPVDRAAPVRLQKRVRLAERPRPEKAVMRRERRRVRRAQDQMRAVGAQPRHICRLLLRMAAPRSEEHTSELQSLMSISYAVFCLKKKNQLEVTAIDGIGRTPYYKVPTSAKIDHNNQREYTQ